MKCYYGASLAKKQITQKMADTHAICTNHPIRSPLSDEEIREGCIYFLQPSGGSDNCKISNVLSGDKNKEMKRSRLIIVYASSLPQDMFTN